MLGSGPEEDDPVDRRMVAVLAIAGRYRTEVPLSDIAALLPREGPASAGEIERWVRDHPQHAVLHGTSVASSATGVPTSSDLEARRRRGATYLEAAGALFSGPLESGGRLLRCVCVTGSTAYQEPVEGDDLDFMVVTRNGTNWAFLLFAFLALRFQRSVLRPGGAEWCFNYVLDEADARETFSGATGFLFAREALTARTILGHDFYTDLLSSANWMSGELPRLYATRTGAWRASSIPPSRTPLLLRALNVLIFPVLATFLQFKGLFQNARFRRAGRATQGFRTVTTLGHFSLHSEKYAQLSQLCAPGSQDNLPSAPA